LAHAEDLGFRRMVDDAARHPERAQRADDPHGDLSAVGDQYLLHSDSVESREAKSWVAPLGSRPPSGQASYRSTATSLGSSSARYDRRNSPISRRGVNAEVRVHESRPPSLSDGDRASFTRPDICRRGQVKPISFELDPERLEILDAADRYARERLHPLAARMDEEEWWPDEEFRTLGRDGYLGITAPVELGGAGLDLFASGLVAEAFARWNPALALSWVAHENLCLNNVLRNGNSEQRRRWIPGLCDGSRIGCLALTEPGAGSDALGSMRATARREGDRYVLNGRKLFI